MLLFLLLGLALTIALAVLQGAPQRQYGARIPLMAPYDPARGVEGGRYTQSRTWALTVYSVRLRDGETPDAPALRAAVPAIPYEPDISWVAVTRSPTPADRRIPDARWWNEWRAGFPFRALACSFTDDFRGAVRIEHGWAVPLDAPYGVPRHWILPARILWPGLILDALILGAAALLLWQSRTLPRTIARALRPRPGCCRACGYDLTGLDDGAPCPECGPTPSKTPSASTAPTPGPR